MSDRASYAYAVLLLLLAAIFRLHGLATLPPGLTLDEIDTLRIAETVRSGSVETFYVVRGEGREGLYPSLVVASTALTGAGLIGYRVVSVFIGMATLAVVYTLTRRLFGPLAALAALALLAVGFYPAQLDRSILPETLLPLLSASALLAIAQALSVHRQHDGRAPNSITFAALGVVLGLGIYVHPLHIGIILTAMLFIVYVVITRQPVSRGALGFTSFGILVLIIIAMPYMIASLRQPELAGPARLFEGLDTAVFDPLLRGLGGLVFRGDADPTHNLPARPLIDLVSGLIVALGFVAAVRYGRQPRFTLLLIALFIGLPLALLSPASPDFSRFALLLPLIAVLFGVGVLALHRSLPVPARRWLWLLLVVLLGFNIQWTWRDLFIVWPSQPRVQAAYHTRLAQIAHHIDRTARSLPTVVCTPTLYPPADQVELAEVQIMALMLHREDLPLRYADCGSALVLVNGGERQQIVFPEADGLVRMYPYLAEWAAQGQIHSADDLPPDAVIELDVSQQLADTIGRFMTEATVNYPPETGLSDPIAETPVRLGGNIALLAYDRVETERFAPGAVVPVYTFWRIDGSVPSDLRLFTHLLSDPAVIAVQADTLGVRADLLRPRDVIIQATLLQLPFTIPQGEYILSIGAYEANRGTRLGVFDGDQLRGDRLFIGTITIGR